MDERAISLHSAGCLLLLQAQKTKSPLPSALPEDTCVTSSLGREAMDPVTCCAQGRGQASSPDSC